MRRIILTVGPSLLYEVPITNIHNDKYIYRINGAHGNIEDIGECIKEIRKQVPNADILMDLPGNKVRIGGLANPIQLTKDECFDIPCKNFNYPDFYKHLKPGMKVWANDSVFEFEIVEFNADRITFLSKSTGLLTNNKGVHIRGIHENIPFLFEKDLKLIELANKENLSYVGLSFVRKASDVEEAKKLLNDGINIITKVETIDAVNNVDSILKLSEYILVDRGDLSTDIGVEKIPRFQKFIIEKALYYDVKVFLATQILKNMEEKPIPTIAEIDDLYNIIKTGVYGIQLSEETAVGKFVKECLEIIERVSGEVRSEMINI